MVTLIFGNTKTEIYDLFVLTFFLLAKECKQLSFCVGPRSTTPRTLVILSKTTTSVGVARHYEWVTPRPQQEYSLDVWITTDLAWKWRRSRETLWTRCIRCRSCRPFWTCLWRRSSPAGDRASRRTPTWSAHSGCSQPSWRECCTETGGRIPRRTSEPTDSHRPTSTCKPIHSRQIDHPLMTFSEKWRQLVIFSYDETVDKNKFYISQNALNSAM